MHDCGVHRTACMESARVYTGWCSCFNFLRHLESLMQHLTRLVDMCVRQKFFVLTNSWRDSRKIPTQRHRIGNEHKKTRATKRWVWSTPTRGKGTTNRGNNWIANIRTHACSERKAQDCALKNSSLRYILLKKCLAMWPSCTGMECLMNALFCIKIWSFV